MNLAELGTTVLGYARAMPAIGARAIANVTFYSLLQVLNDGERFVKRGVLGKYFGLSAIGEVMYLSGLTGLSVHANPWFVAIYITVGLGLKLPGSILGCMDAFKEQQLSGASGGTQSATPDLQTIVEAPDGPRLQAAQV